jgi:CubicO group peptidase (beta-lactamase class C family)
MQFKIINVGLIILFTFSLLSCKKNEININSVAEYENYINQEIKDQGIPAISVLIFKENQTLYEGYFGKSNIEQNTDLKSDDIFLLASISKVVTATALLQLYEDGEFSLDDNINDYLPFHVVHPKHETPITIKMLLTHTSSIDDGSAIDSQYYFGEDSPVSLDLFLENYLTPTGNYYNEKENFHNFEPGKKHKYSNEGSALIAVLVEQISNQSFNDYCKENIFQPLGMTNTFWRLDEIDQTSQTIVQPYNLVKDKFEPIQHYTFTDYPNGGLRSNAKDMAILLSCFAQNGNSGTGEILNESTVIKMITPQIPDIDKEVGLHLFLMNSDNNLWGHNGGEQGVATIMAFNPTTKIGAIILTNQGEVDLDEILLQAYKLGLKL